MKKNNLIPIALGLAVGIHAQALAGEQAVTPAAAPAKNNGDWCSLLKSKPKLYKNKKNPYIQEIGIEGRIQWQTAHTEVDDVLGNENSETFTEWRRARLGTKIKFLNYFSAKYQVNLVDDARPSNGDVEWGYDSIDEAYLTFDLGKALGENYFDELTLKYGRHKFLLGHEATQSSKQLLTPERSALSNKVYGSSRVTGLLAEAAKDDWNFGAALYSSSQDGEDNEAFGSWQDGEVFWGHVGHKASDKLSLATDFVYNNVDPGDDDEIGYEWAQSINAHYEEDRWGVIADVIYGDNGEQSRSAREGSFYGAMVMPYYWLVEDKLQAVAQVEHMASSEAEGVRTNSRYARRTESYGSDINSGRGDSHQSIYAGLNYYLCGHNAKVQGGVEYQTMDTPDGDFDALTYILAFRAYF